MPITTIANINVMHIVLAGYRNFFFLKFHTAILPLLFLLEWHSLGERGGDVAVAAPLLRWSGALTSSPCHPGRCYREKRDFA